MVTDSYIQIYISDTYTVETYFQKSECSQLTEALRFGGFGMTSLFSTDDVVLLKRGEREMDR